LGRLSAVPAMKAGLMSMHTSAMAVGGGVILPRSAV